jgi:hypothetical protein
MHMDMVYKLLRVLLGFNSGDLTTPETLWKCVFMMDERVNTGETKGRYRVRATLSVRKAKRISEVYPPEVYPRAKPSEEAPAQSFFSQLLLGGNPSDGAKPE